MSISNNNNNSNNQLLRGLYEERIRRMRDRHTAALFGGGGGGADQPDDDDDDPHVKLFHFDVRERNNIKRCTIKIIEEPGHFLGSHIWDSAIVMCNYLVQQQQQQYNNNNNNNWFANKTVIELGSGVGLVGICIAKLFGPTSVTMTDKAEALDLLRMNIKLNFPPPPPPPSSAAAAAAAGGGGGGPEGKQQQQQGTRVQAAELTWGASRSGGGGGATAAADDNLLLLSCYDYIVGSDIIYRPSLFMPLIETMKQLAHPDTRILIAYRRGERLTPQEEEQFFALLRENGLELLNETEQEEQEQEQEQERVLSPPAPPQSSGGTQILKIRPKKQ